MPSVKGVNNTISGGKGGSTSSAVGGETNSSSKRDKPLRI